MKAQLYVLTLVALLSPYNLDAMSASASTPIGGTTALALASPPTYCANAPNGCFQTTGMAYVTYRNNLNVSVLAIVLWVVHNSLGQTVGYGTSTVTLAPGANATAYPIAFGLAPGPYNSTVFAIAPSGVAISKSTALLFNLTNQ